MARPRIHTEPRVVAAVRLPVTTRDQLRKVARERDVSVSHLVNRAVEDLLASLPEDSMVSLGSEAAIR